jgi:hypothetical protein
MGTEVILLASEAGKIGLKMGTELIAMPRTSDFGGEMTRRVALCLILSL